MNGPVSRAIADAVADFARRGPVVWLDKRGELADLATQLAEGFAAGHSTLPVLCHRGSFLELLLALDDRADGVDPVPLVVYVPGCTVEEIRATPVLELLRAGRCYERTLAWHTEKAAAGRVPPDALAQCLAGEGLTLAAADAWLERASVRADGGAVAAIDRFSEAMVLDDLLDGGELSQSMEADPEPVWDHLARRFGVDAAWRALTRERGARPHAHAALALAGFALCVEYVHDLRRPPADPRLQPLASLPAAVVSALAALTAHLRDRRRDVYVRYAEEFASRFQDELSQVRPEDLGRIDTFREEEARVYRAALEALPEGRFDDVAQQAALRLGEGAFWVQRDPARQHAWQLVAAAAAVGRRAAGARALLAGAASVEEAALRYADLGHVVDRVHRELEQRRAALLQPNLPHYDLLRAALDQVRVTYRAWADESAMAFATVCESCGFLPTESMRQRTFFDQAVRPATSDGTVALFLVDALRYEMGAALRDALLADDPGVQADLRARLCELPSVTEIGMNALAPVAVAGRLRPALKGKRFLGFDAGEFRVDDPKSRVRAMHARVGGDTPPRWSLDELVDAPPPDLRARVARAKLVVVDSDKIDRAGEKNVGLGAFESALRDLRTGWQLLRDAGVRKFVFTADHGFLLLDGTTKSVMPFGQRVDPSRRHALYPEAVRQKDQSTVPLARLDYDGVADHLLFPRTTAVFNTGDRRQTFVHGGNSLQERVIPVLTLTHRRPAGGDSVRYALEGRALEAQAGCHRLELRVVLARGQSAPLAFGGAQTVELRLRIEERDDVTAQIADVRGGGERLDGSVRARVGERVEVLFRLAGPEEDRVRVEVVHPLGEAVVEPLRPADRFQVEAPPPPRVASPEVDRLETRPLGAAPPEVESDDPPSASSVAGGESWLASIEHAGHRKVLAQLQVRTVVTERDLLALLGDMREVRRFARAFDALLACVPFRVRVESSAEGKRYVKE